MQRYSMQHYNSAGLYNKLLLRKLPSSLQKLLSIQTALPFTANVDRNTGNGMPARNDCALTHTGNVRTNNEDAFLAEPTLKLWVVADGMGGHEAGEVASAITIKAINKSIEQGKNLSDAIQNAHHDVLDGGLKGIGPAGMGSTVVAVHCADSRYQVGWVGDSRAYLWTRHGEHKGDLQLITTDHSYVQMLIDAGAITEEEADSHPDKNVITQCLGSLDLADVKVDVIEGEWQTNQWIVLCSDGLTDELQDSQISAILANCQTAEDAANALLREALHAGGRDNTTVIVLGKPEQQKTVWQKIKTWLRAG